MNSALTPVRPTPRAALSLVLAAALVHATAAWLGRNPGFLTGQDDVQYLLLAQSIREGSYREVWRIAQPLHSLYPPGYPAILAVWGLVVGDRFDGLVALSVIAGGATVLMLGAALTRVVHPTLAVASTWVVALNDDLIGTSGAIGSEAVFIALVVAALSALAGADSTGRHRLATALAVAATTVRIPGIVAIGAVALVWFRHRGAAGLAWPLIGGLATAGAWLLWSAVAPDQFEGVSYARDLVAGSGAGGLPAILSRPGDNLVYYLPRLLWTGGIPAVAGTSVDNVVGAGLLVVTGAAGVAGLLRWWPAAGWFTIGYVALLAVWTWHVIRYLTPVAIFLLPASILGAAVLAIRLGNKARIVGLALAAVFGGVAAFRSAPALTQWAGCEPRDGWPPAECLSPEQADYFSALSVLRQETPPGAVVLAAKYVTTYFFSQRRVVSYQEAVGLPPERFGAHLVAAGVDYVILGRLYKSEATDLAAAVLAACGDLVVERRFGEATLLLRRVEGADPSPRACEAIVDYRRRSASFDFDTAPIGGRPDHNRVSR